MMPLTLTLIRHGQSESNLAKHSFEQGKVLENEDELMKVHTSDRRLTALGVVQAKAAGTLMRGWVEETGIEIADCRFYVSTYMRAIETAGHLQIPRSEWRLDNRLVERNWGEMDQKPYEERMKLYGAEAGRRKEFALYWRPDTGETMQDVVNRLRDFTDTMHRECERKHVVVVCHGETMWAFRTILEYWTGQQLRNAMLTHDDRTDIHNCRIIQYSRVLDDEHRATRLTRVRFVDPINPADESRNLDWQKIKRPLYTSDQLLELAEAEKRFLAAE